ncbi:MAG: cytochrome c maturation protein CcmE [Thermoplasmata archaeon]|nr:cytochrome c maturation protein CcmE [Thermoplasmata archaeon]
MEETEPQKPESDAKKKLILKVVVVLAVIAILVVIFLSAAPADPYDTVDKVMADPSKYEGKQVEVRGTVETWLPFESAFNLTGYSEEDPTYIVISYNAVPSQFANGKDVVVKGLFHHNGSAYQIDVVDANDILVGCSSRY